MYRLTHLSEKVLWWYRGMNQLTDLLLSDPRRQGELEILDAGCGTGGVLVRLARRGRVTGVDISDLALDVCRRRGLRRLAYASTLALPRESHPTALRKFARVLRSGG